MCSRIPVLDESMFRSVDQAQCERSPCNGGVLQKIEGTPKSTQQWFIGQAFSATLYWLNSKPYSKREIKSQSKQ